MNDSDDTIRRFMNEYLQGSSEKPASKKEDLIVNFDITYSDGMVENHTCREQSEVFGRDDEGCIENKIEAEEMKFYYKEASEYPSECEIKEPIKNESYNFESSNLDLNEYKVTKEKIRNNYCEEDKSLQDEYIKWNNCSDEIEDKNNNICEKEEVKGEISVYVTLGSKEGIKLKGVTINLYRINGECPELIACTETDCNGRASFINVSKGSYRVVELINKKYFHKPIYIKWDETKIDEENKSTTIYVVNKIRR